jgi:hypothetical protein
MNMKWFIFKRFLVGIFIVSLSCPALFAREGYEKRINKYTTHWEKLIPSYEKIQFAGSMGLLSFGVGWDYGKKNQWETDAFLGFVPKYDTDKFKVTFTLKQNYIPWKVPLGNAGFSMDPLTTGLYMNTVFGGDFWATEPDKYPSGYYNFSTKVRFNVFLGQRFTYKIPRDKRYFIKAITFYYELSTCDLYVVSAFNNKYLKPDDYLGLSFGLKLTIL